LGADPISIARPDFAQVTHRRRRTSRFDDQANQLHNLPFHPNGLYIPEERRIAAQIKL
jgi:hypothetical protein